MADADVLPRDRELDNGERNDNNIGGDDDGPEAPRIGNDDPLAADANDDGGGNGNGGDDDDDPGAELVDAEDPAADDDQQDRIRRLAERRRRALNLRTKSTANRFLQYTTLSLTSAVLLVYWAFYTRQQFYPAVVYLSSSKFAYVTLGNAWICLTVLTFRLLTYTFLDGGLRTVEREAVGDGLRWGLMETCLALTIFREEVTWHMAAMFLLLALGKCLHWSVELRGAHLQQTDALVHHHVEHHVDSDVEDGPQQQQDANARRAKGRRHAGFLTLTILLLISDFFAVVHCATYTSTHGPSVHILFGVEAAILLVGASSTLCTYGLHVIDHVFFARRGKTWHGRGTVSFALEVSAEGCRFLFYLIFFTIVFTYYGMPINIFRDLWVSYTNLRRKLASFAKYRQLTKNMNDRFDDATEEELAECGHVCIICRDSMGSATTPTSGGAGTSSHGGGGGGKGKKLPCGHVFHFYCLREWLQQQQTCPTCRGDIPADGGRKRRAREAAEARNAAAAAEAAAPAVEGAGADDAGAAAGEGTAQPPAAEAAAAEKKEGKGRPRPSWDEEDDEGDSSPFPCLYRVVAAAAAAGGGGASDGGGGEDGGKGAAVYELDDRHLEPNPNGAGTPAAGSAVENATVSAPTPPPPRIVRTVPPRKVVLCTEIRWVRCPLPHHRPPPTTTIPLVDSWDEDDDGGGGGGAPADAKKVDVAAGATAADAKEGSEGGGTEVGTAGRMMLRMPDGWVAESDLVRIPVPLSGWITPTTPPAAAAASAASS